MSRRVIGTLLAPQNAPVSCVGPPSKCAAATSRENVAETNDDRAGSGSGPSTAAPR